MARATDQHRLNRYEKIEELSIMVFDHICPCFVRVDPRLNQLHAFGPAWRTPSVTWAL